MSCDISVRARGLQKRYNLFDSNVEALSGLFFGKKARKHHWALRDIDLEANAGDFIGIVGRNGAGKSTLLQIIAGILTPDSGSLEINGRVAALLELGAGFSPHFTGWENVKLSASLYGLNASQIDERLDSINETAGLGDFMNRPTREYSSGMLAKLAFSVCLHVDAEILIVDELLGVGDFRFRQRAAQRLLKISENGIVFFVSHSESTVLSLCNRAIFIDEGRKLRDGSTKSVFRSYQRAMSKLTGDSGTFYESGDDVEEAPDPSDLSRSNNQLIDAGELSQKDFFERTPQIQLAEPRIIESVYLNSEENGERPVFVGGERMVLTVRTREINLSDVYVVVMVKDAFGQTVCARDTLDVKNSGKSEQIPRVFGAEFEFDLPYFPSGDYAFAVASALVGDPGVWIDFRDAAAEFSIDSRHISDGFANIAMDDVSITTADVT